MKLLSYIPYIVPLVEVLVKAIHERHVEGLSAEEAHALAAGATARVRRAQALARGAKPR